jgi:hypothetical protein
VPVLVGSTATVWCGRTTIGAGGGSTGRKGQSTKVVRGCSMPTVGRARGCVIPDPKDPILASKIGHAPSVLESLALISTSPFIYSCSCAYGSKISRAGQRQGNSERV